MSAGPSTRIQWKLAVASSKVGAGPDEGLHLRSGLWKQLSRSSKREIWLSGLALAATALATLMPASLQAEGIQTATQLHAETSRAASGIGTLTTFTVHVTSANDDASPSGVVTLADGARQIGSALLDANGDAKVAASNLSAGTHDIHAIYNGNQALASSLSTETQVTAEAAGLADFSITATSTALTVAQGNAVTTILTLTPINGYSGYITLSCSGLILDAGCTFVPGNVFVGGAKASSSTMSVTTMSATQTAARLSEPAAGHHSVAFAFIFPGVIGLAGLGLRKRRDWSVLGMFLLVLSMAGAVTGCSERYHYLNRSPVASPGTLVGDSAFTLEAQAISGTTVLIHQIPFTLKVTAPPAP